MERFWRFVRGIVVLVGLASLGGFITYAIGIFLNILELIQGEHDYSDWVIMSVAERPIWEIAVGFTISVALLILCFSQMDKLDRLIERNRFWRR